MAKGQIRRANCWFSTIKGKNLIWSKEWKANHYWNHNFVWCSIFHEWFFWCYFNPVWWNRKTNQWICSPTERDKTWKKISSSIAEIFNEMVGIQNVSGLNEASDKCFYWAKTWQNLFCFEEFSKSKTFVLIFFEFPPNFVLTCLLWQLWFSWFVYSEVNTEISMDRANID